MKDSMAKKQRKERKKMKLAALASIMELNGRDRSQTMDPSATELSQPNTDESKNPEDTTDDGFVTVNRKNKNLSNKASQSMEDILSVLKRKRESSDKEHISIGSIDETPCKKLKEKNIEGNCEEMANTNVPDSKLHSSKIGTEKKPSFNLKEFGLRASLDVKEGCRVPIFLTDIQHLLMLVLFGKSTPCPTDRWCQMDLVGSLQHTVVVVLEGVSLFHYIANETKFAPINKLFNVDVEVTFPPYKKDGILEELIQAPLLYTYDVELIKKHGCLEVAVDLSKDPTLSLNGLFKIASKIETGDGSTDESDDDEKKDTGKDELPLGDKVPRTKLLLSALQMVEEGYPVPLRGELHSRFRNYVFTKDLYYPVTNHSPLYAVDCEMCKTTVGLNELTRISIVNEKLETVYETHVMPSNKIVDYLTRYSGITPEIMKTVTKSLYDVQVEVRTLLPSDAILVGQSLNSDLNAMRMMHPYVIDTSVCFNMTGIRKRKSKLAALALTFLKESIQKHEDGHDSVEDSLASIRLVKMKLANSLEFGDEVLLRKRRLYEILLVNPSFLTLPSHPDARKRTVVVSTGELLPKIKKLIEKTKETVPENTRAPVLLHEESSNKQSVRKACNAIANNAITIVRLSFQPEEFQESSIEYTTQKINKWITKLWGATPGAGLFTVVMGGSTECPGGVLKLSVKPAATDGQ